MYQQGSRAFGHHVKTCGPQSKFGYKDFNDTRRQPFTGRDIRFVAPVQELRHI
jgi:alpha-L-fucosidase